MNQAISNRTSLSDLLDNYPVVLDVRVAWGDMDALGHVNNARYFSYFESARLAYFYQIGFMKMMDETGIGPILASTSCRFRAPIKHPDTLAVGARVSDISDDRFTMQYLIESQSLGQVAAEGSGLIVCFDYTNHCKTDLPQALVEKIRAIEPND